MRQGVLYIIEDKKADNPPSYISVNLFCPTPFLALLKHGVVQLVLGDRENFIATRDESFVREDGAGLAPAYQVWPAEAFTRKFQSPFLFKVVLVEGDRRETHAGADGIEKVIRTAAGIGTLARVHQGFGFHQVSIGKTDLIFVLTEVQLGRHSGLVGEAADVFTEEVAGVVVAGRVHGGACGLQAIQVGDRCVVARVSIHYILSKIFGEDQKAIAREIIGGRRILLRIAAGAGGYANEVAVAGACITPAAIGEGGVYEFYNGFGVELVLRE